MKQNIHTIDATDKVLGRLASEIAHVLQGKNKVEYAPNIDIGDIVLVKNVSKMIFTGRKFKQKKYYHHSGYMGGLREIPLAKLFLKDPEDVLKRAVWNMLPKNKLRKPRIKKLRFEKYAKQG